MSPQPNPQAVGNEQLRTHATRTLPADGTNARMNGPPYARNSQQQQQQQRPMNGAPSASSFRMAPAPPPSPIGAPVPSSAPAPMHHGSSHMHPDNPRSYDAHKPGAGATKPPPPSMHVHRPPPALHAPIEGPSVNGAYNPAVRPPGAAPYNPNAPSQIPSPMRTSRFNSVSNLDRFDHEELSIVASDEGSSSHDSESVTYRSEVGSVYGDSSRVFSFFSRSGRRRRSRHSKRRRGRNKRDADKNDVVVNLVRKETKIVNKLRYAVMFLLFVVPVLFGALMWDLARDKNEYRDDLNQAIADGTAVDTDKLLAAQEPPLWFESFVQSFEHLWIEHSQNILSSLFTVSSLYTSSNLDVSVDTQAAGTSWPLVTMDNLETIVTGMYQTLQPTYITFAPLIFNVQSRIDQFLSYAIQQQQQTCPLIGCQVVTEISQNTDNGADAQGDAFNHVNPVWQIVPPFIGDNANQTFVLHDQMDNGIQTVIDNKISYWTHGTSTSSTPASSSSNGSGLQIPPPVTVHYPVFATFQQNTVVGVVSMIFSLQTLIQAAVVPPEQESSETVTVTESPEAVVRLNVRFECAGDTNTVTASAVSDEQNASVFHVLSDGSVVYVSEGDNNDVGGKSVNVDWEETLTLPTAYAYGEFHTASDSVTAVCPLRIDIIPLTLYSTGSITADASSETTTADEPRLRETVLFPILAALALCILASLFATYDFYVEKRQSVVVKFAAKFSALVNNLFPEQVRDRMLQEVEENNNKKNEVSSGGIPGLASHGGGTSTSNGLGGMGGSGGGLNGAATNAVPNNSGKGSSSNVTGSASNKNLADSSTDPNNPNSSGSPNNADTGAGDGKKGSGGGKKKKNGSRRTQNGAPVSVKQFLSKPEVSYDLSSQPIADFFQNTTVLFADIAGFTAWSSQREPPQVFRLLETLYRSFDVIAAKLKVFKVETIGDCYMAVTGLPNPDANHAIHMSRFAYQSLLGMQELIKELESILGPGTSDLALRVGLHSGPVTAGVLRGDKSRFQLFGDTVNTASRMESTGERGRIQVSQETADLLIAAGKSHWLKPREQLVVAKGKGELKTFWLDPNSRKRRATKVSKEVTAQNEFNVTNLAGRTSASAIGGSTNPNQPGTTASATSSGMGLVPTATVTVNRNDAIDTEFDSKYSRLIDWSVETLLVLLARVITVRSRRPPRGSMVNHSAEVALLPSAINDVAEVVALPPFDPEVAKMRREEPDVSMMEETRADLHEYIRLIVAMYRENPFHNFEHAAHVALCANKMLGRLRLSTQYKTEEELHNATFGISSDPLTHFAIIFSALIHDVDHTGLPNARLVKDRHEVAIKFENKSVAEQNSIHIAWELLMDPRFERLRKCIYQTNVERKRFRQLVINCVMATDIAERSINEIREQKWNRAFRRPALVPGQVTATGQLPTPLQLQEDMNRKATVVIEHMMQVSDVAHTMQDYHIYRRWNERLFHEKYNAYRAGLANADPATDWYRGELGFFDFYLLPLAKKIQDCGAFGQSGHEYLYYVVRNKREWERKGSTAVQEMQMLFNDADMNDEDDLSYYTESGSEMDSDDIGYDSPGDLTDSDDDYSGQYDDYDGQYDDDYISGEEGSSMDSSSDEDDAYDGEDDNDVTSMERMQQRMGYGDYSQSAPGPAPQ